MLIKSIYHISYRWCLLGPCTRKGLTSFALKARQGMQESRRMRSRRRSAASGRRTEEEDEVKLNVLFRGGSLFLCLTERHVS